MGITRLQKFFTDCGVLSRRAAEAEIEAGRVTVNGHVATIGTKIDASRDLVVWKGKRIEQKEKNFTYIVLNKPRGYLTSVSDPDGRRCVTELLEGVNTRVYPVGRLDKCSEGILLLTDDGELANRLMHPRHSVGKVYRVKVGGRVSPEQYDLLTSAMVIDGYKIRPVQVVIASEDESGTVLKMTLHEGRNRQIRKMCEQAGLTVRRLSRISIGKIKLNGLPVGQYRHLTDEEVSYLYQNTQMKKTSK